MLYIHIVYWVLLVLFSISYVVTLIIPLSTANDNVKISYLYLLSCFLSSVIFVSIKEIVLIETAIFVWKILSAFPCFLVLIICLFYKKKSFNNVLSFVGATLIGIIPFIIDVNVTPSVMFLPSLKNTYSLDVILIAAVSFTTILLWMATRISIKRNRTMLNSINRLYEIVESNKDTDLARLKSFKSPYEKILLEELTSLTGDFKRSLHRTSSELRTLTEISTIVNQKNNGEYDDIRPLFREIKGDIEELKDNFSTLSLYKDSKFDLIGFNNLDIVRELNHFLATPFSSIVTNCELLRRQIQQKKNLASAILYIDRIDSSVKLCQCVIKAYREITKVSDSFLDSSQTIKQGLFSAFDLFKLEYSKPNLRIQIEADDTISGYSNNLIISLISPLLQNSVYASPDYELIEVALCEQNQYYSVKISNKSLILPDMKSLNTVGYSSKENHTGTGLLIVRHLLQLRKSGDLFFEINENKITFEIKLKKNYDK